MARFGALDSRMIVENAVRCRVVAASSAIAGQPAPPDLGRDGVQRLGLHSDGSAVFASGT